MPDGRESNFNPLADDAARKNDSFTRYEPGCLHRNNNYALVLLDKKTYVCILFVKGIPRGLTYCDVSQDNENKIIRTDIRTTKIIYTKINLNVWVTNFKNIFFYFNIYKKKK